MPLTVMSELSGLSLMPYGFHHRIIDGIVGGLGVKVSRTRASKTSALYILHVFRKNVYTPKPVSLFVGNTAAEFKIVAYCY